MKNMNSCEWVWLHYVEDELFSVTIDKYCSSDNSKGFPGFFFKLRTAYVLITSKLFKNWEQSRNWIHLKLTIFF